MSWTSFGRTARGELEIRGGGDAGDVEAGPAGGGHGQSGDGEGDARWRQRLGKVGFYGVTPVVQPAGADQAAVTLGNVDGEIGGLTSSDPPTQAEVQALRDKCEELADDARALATLINSLRAAFVAHGLVKGSS